ncbi:hypothetical protein DSO57_1030055 [Entomophthora muscae]|uniref:Uncharacterized protein n=1 Tax=Entomophthora muscae TaxID=34485 RepID=A0ACC2RFM0_9FUNG|nr:hypothetical protein DSO57_1030055 [Entomophthora muscae]
MTNISHQLNSLAGHQNFTANWAAQLEEHLTNYVVTIVGTMLEYKGLDNNWLGTVTHHIKGAEATFCYLCSKVELLCHSVRMIEDGVASEGNRKATAIIQQDTEELSEHVSEIDKGLCQSLSDCNHFNVEFPKFSKMIDHNHNCTEENHDNLERLSDSHWAMQEKNNVLFEKQESRMEKLKDKLQVENCTIKDLAQEVQLQRSNILHLQGQVEHLLQAYVSQIVSDPVLQTTTRRSQSVLSTTSQAISEDCCSFHSYESNEDNIGRTMRKVYVAEPVLDISETPLPGAAALTSRTSNNARDAASEAQFCASNQRNTSTPPRRSYNFSTSSVIQNFKPKNLPKFDKKVNVHMFLWLYNNSMYGADKAMKNAAIFNCLNSENQTIIMPRLLEQGWTYKNISRALIAEFGSKEALFCQKMEFTKGKIKKGESLIDFSERFYLKAQTLVSIGAATFVDVKGSLLNYVRPNRELSIALKSRIYGARTVPELMHHLGSFKEQFKFPFPDYKKATLSFSKKPKGKTWEKDLLKKSTIVATPSTNSTAINCTCYKCGQLGHLSWDFKQLKAYVQHLGQEDSKEDKPVDKDKDQEEDGDESKKLLSSQVEEKTLTASSSRPSLSIDPDPKIPDCNVGLLDQEACPKRYLPDKEEINKDLLHRVLAINTVTRKQAICTESIPSKEAVDTISIPYAEQLSMPYTKVTHKSDSVNKLSQLLRLVQVSTNLDTLKSLKPNLTTALESFLAQFKGLDIHKVTKITSPYYGEQHNCTYIELVVHKLWVRAILDSGALGNIVSTNIVKKLKLAPDLDYNEKFGRTGPDKTKALRAYSSLPLCFGKLVVTAPAIVLHNESYDILIGTSFMATYGTIINHQNSTFSILGHSVPMFYHSDGPRDLPTKKIHYINMEYADGDMPVVYTLRQRKIKALPLATKEYKGILLYSSSEFSIPTGSQVIHNTGLSLSFPKGMHCEVYGLHNGLQLEPWILPGIVMSSSEEILVLLGNILDKSLRVKKHQLLGYMKLEENSSLMDVTPFGKFSEFALPCNQLSVLLLILCESLNGLTEDQKDQAIWLFEKCKDVFAENDQDLGKALGVKHVLDTQGAAPICSRPIRCSLANQAIVNK